VAGTVATGLRTPWGIAFLPDGSALVGERDSGRIIRIATGGGKSTAGTVAGVSGGRGGEGGLLGLAVPPDFEEKSEVYAYYSIGGSNRIVRMPYREGRLGAPKVLVDDVPHAVIHNGGRLAFGPDGMLYATTGESGRPELAQDRESLGGKILRMTPDGKPAPGNPFGTLVWSYGHRNVEGLAWDSGKRLWATEFGENKWDELNLIGKGRNYGWPEVEGRGGTDHGRYTNPAVAWRTKEAGPVGIAILDGAAYIGGLTGNRLWRVPLNGAKAGKPFAYFNGRYGRIRTVTAAPDGSLWITTSNTDGRGHPKAGDDRILRVTVG
jgi:glucose/arabinose dehydrogenase